MALATLHHHLPLATTLPSTVNHLVELETPSSPSTSCLPPSLQGRTLNPTFLSRYRILYELGSGGFGFVCAIEPKPRGSSVGLACKFILKAKALSGLAMDPTLGWVPLEVYVLRNVCSAFFSKYEKWARINAHAFNPWTYQMAHDNIVRWVTIP